MKQRMLLLCLLLNSLLSFSSEPIKIAVASNFTETLKKLVAHYNQTHETPFYLSSAGTGVLYQQIREGAPFDVFFSADSKHIDLLIQQHQADAEHAFTYAKGTLVLWYPHTQRKGAVKDFIIANCAQKIAIANPKIAPYGEAAKQALSSMQLFKPIKSCLITANNVSQAYLFTKTKNSALGFISYAQLKQTQDDIVSHHFWMVPEHYYRPISQKVALLNRSKRKEEVQRFLHFLQSPEARKVIERSGFKVINKG